MPTLPELVPDLDVLLAMPPGELGPLVMRVVEGMRTANGQFHPSNILEPTLLYGRGIPTGRPVYPGGREREVDLAVREGLQWLDQNGFTVAANSTGWAMFTRKGEELLHPVPPPGHSGDANPRLIRSVGPLAMFVTATGANEIPMPLRAAAEPVRGPGALSRTVTVGQQTYQITGIGWGTRPPWDFIRKDGAPLGREGFLALPPADRQELFNHVQAYASAEFGGRLRIDLVGVPAPVAGITRGGALGSAVLNTSPLNTFAPNAGGTRPSASTTPTFATGYNEGEDEHRDAAGNALTDAEVEGLINVGDPISDSNDNLILDGGSAVATGSLGGPIRVSPMRGFAVAGPPSAPPPEIPEPGPALIEPEWEGDRLTLPKRLPANDLWEHAVLSLVTAVRDGFVQFSDAVAQSGTNFHPAARTAIHAIPDLLSGDVDQVRIFRMGHAVEHLEALQPVVDDELPDALRVQYRTVVGQFRRLVERFPAWRALESKAQGEPLTDEEAQQAVPVARELAAALSTEAAAEVADVDIANALSDLAGAAEAASGAERRLLSFDLVESVKQIVTALMRPVVYCWNQYSARAWDELKKVPSELGSGTVKWGKKVVLGIAGLYVGAGSLTPIVTHLAATYPTLSWLPAVAEFLKFFAGLPAG